MSESMAGFVDEGTKTVGIRAFLVPLHKLTPNHDVAVGFDRFGQCCGEGCAPTQCAEIATRHDNGAADEVRFESKSLGQTADKTASWLC
jgi:hypothetical protein